MSIREEIVSGAYQRQSTTPKRTTNKINLPEPKKKKLQSTPFVAGKPKMTEGNYNKLPEKKSLLDNFGDAVKNVGDKIINFVNKVPEKTAEVVTHPKETIVGIGKGVKDASEFVNRSFDEKVMLPIKAGLDKDKTYDDLLSEYRKQPTFEESEKKLAKKNDYVAPLKNVNPFIKAVDTETYKKAQAGKLNEEQQNAFGIGQSIGKLIPALGATALTKNPNVGKMVFGSMVQQNYQEQAKAEGKTELQSIAYSIPMTIAETFLEGKLGIGFGLKQNNLIRTSIGEGLEEFVIPYIDSAVRKIGFNEDIDLKKTTEEALNSAVDGIVMGIILQGSTNLVPNAKKVMDKIQNKQKVSSQEIKLAVEDTQKALGEDILGQSIEEIANKTNTEFSNLKGNTQTNVLSGTNTLGNQESVLNAPQNAKKEVITPVKENVNNNIGNKLPIYHSTSFENIKSIQKNGFNGERAYFATNRDIATQNYGSSFIELNANDFNLKDITEQAEGFPTTEMRDNAKREGYDGVKYKTSKNNYDVEIFNGEKLKKSVEQEEYNNLKLAIDLSGGIENLNQADINRYEELSKKYFNSKESTSYDFEKNIPKDPTKESSYGEVVKKKTTKSPKITKELAQTIADRINEGQVEDVIVEKGQPEMKMRRWVETSTESDIVDHEIIPEDLDIRKIVYEVKSNKQTLERANAIIGSRNFEGAYLEFNRMFNSGNLPTAEQITLGERLIQESLKKKDYETAGQLIENVAILGTEMGQGIQALSLINRLTPEGQLRMLSKTVKRMKDKGVKGAENIKVTPEMVEKVLSKMKEDGSWDKIELDNAVEEVKQDIANQMQTTITDKMVAWRYLSMLGNPKTHIKNIVSNAVMSTVRKGKNAIARTIEDIVPIKTKTKTWKKASQEVKDFSKQTTKEMRNIITGEDKYDMNTDIQRKKQIFKTKWLEKAREINSNLLEKEDWLFSSNAFNQSFSEYLTANNIKTQQDISENPSIIEQAKLYAVEESQKATFRQYSKLATVINKIEQSNSVGKLLVGGVMPFKKTPINIVKTGVRYSPAGLIETLSKGSYDLAKGNITANQYIDNLSQGLTGTSLSVLGYVLGSMGILSGSSDEDKKGKYKSQLGTQPYSITIGNKNYTIDWLSPSAMPLFVGVEFQKVWEEGEELDFNAGLESLAKTIDPLNEMSMVQGINKALTSYNSKEVPGGTIGNVGISALESYTTQFIPTVAGQVARTIDDKVRNTKVSGTSPAKIPERLGRQVLSKIPVASQLLEPSTDVWGNEVKRPDNVLERTFDNFIAPYYKKELTANKVDNEIMKIFDKTGNDEVIPNIPFNYLTYKNNKYDMSAKEYTNFKETYGQTSANMLEKLIKTDTYRQSKEKDKLIDKVYEYAREQAKFEYFDSKDINYKPNLTYISNLKEQNIDFIDYIENKDGYDFSFKNPEKYKMITQIDDYKNYQKYKERIDNIKSKFASSQGTKESVIRYVNSLNLSIPKKAMLIRNEYSSYEKYNKQIVEYINSQKMTPSEKADILKELGFKISNGKVSW